MREMEPLDKEALAIKAIRGQLPIIGDVHEVKYQEKWEITVEANEDETEVCPLNLDLFQQAQPQFYAAIEAFAEKESREGVAEHDAPLEGPEAVAVADKKLIIQIGLLLAIIAHPREPLIKKKSKTSTADPQARRRFQFYRAVSDICGWKEDRKRIGDELEACVRARWPSTSGSYTGFRPY